MAWNRSTTDTEKAKREAEQRKSSILKGASAFVIVVAVLAGVAIYIFSGDKSEKPVRDDAKKSLIKEVTPAPAPKAETNVVKKVDPKARPTKVGEIVNNYIKLPSGRIHYIRGEVTNDVGKTSRDWFAIFDYRCDNDIACLLTLKPGETLVGTPVYRGQFKKQFLESLKTPILIGKDDPPEIQDLKRSMIQTKADLKAAYDRGEDIEKIMLDTREQLQDMSIYKQTLERDMKEMIRSDAKSIEDVDTFLEAANKMLEAKGIAPMELGPVARRRLERLIQEQKGE